MAATHLGGYGCSLWADRDRPAGIFALLEALLTGIPRLDGCLCYSEPDAFDAGADSEQIAKAISLCGRCPAFGRCGRFVDSMSTRQKESLTGVWAGVDYGGTVDVVRRRR